ncbi:hypothetical protein GWI34_19705 [Actinomadura sp. DSM 109109]|nr:hypothetical protein [Actinomadura lepetitiana]
MKRSAAGGPQNMALGAGLTLAEGSSKLFGRSIFKNYLLDGITMSALAVATVEYGIGAAVLLLVAYRYHILDVFRRVMPPPERLRATRRAMTVMALTTMMFVLITTAEYGVALAFVLVAHRFRGPGASRREGPPPLRLRFTWQAVLAIVLFAGCNIMGRGMMVLAMTSAGTALATINAITFAVSTMTYSTEVWQAGQRWAAMLVPLLITLGLAVSIEAWHIAAHPWGVIWSIGSALSGIIYMVLSRPFVDRGGAEADQFQALGTALGVVGLAIWASLAGESLSGGWSWGVLWALVCTALMTVVVPRYLHMRARKALGDAVYTILWSVVPLLGLLVDLIMEQKIPTVWQVVGMSWIGVIAAGASVLRMPPEARAALRRRFRGVAERLEKLFGREFACG